MQRLGCLVHSRQVLGQSAPVPTRLQRASVRWQSFNIIHPREPIHSGSIERQAEQAVPLNLFPPPISSWVATLRQQNTSLATSGNASPTILSAAFPALRKHQL